MLNETLDEEKETDEKLTELAEQINSSANEGEGNEGDEEETPRKDAVQVVSKKKSKRVA